MHAYEYYAAPGPTSCRARGCERRPGEAPRPAETGSELCAFHHRMFRDALEALAVGYRAVEQASYTKARKGEYSKVQTSGIADVSTYWNPAAAALRVELQQWVIGLVHLVRNHHADYVAPVAAGESYPSAPRPDAPRTLADNAHPVELLLRLRRDYATWVSHFPDGIGAAYLDDARRYIGKARKAQDTEQQKVVTLAASECGAVIDDVPGYGAVTCSAPLRLLYIESESHSSRVVCSANPAHVQPTPDQWMELGNR